MNPSTCYLENFKNVPFPPLSQEAEGEDFDGCDSVPPLPPPDVCGMKKDRGPDRCYARAARPTPAHAFSLPLRTDFHNTE